MNLSGFTEGSSDHSCGHNYCMNRIKDHWDTGDMEAISTCPLCGQTFIPRPVLMKSSMLVVLAEELKRTGLQVDPCPTGSGDGDPETCTELDVKVSQFLHMEKSSEKLQEKIFSQTYKDGQRGELHVHNGDPIKEEPSEKEKRKAFKQRGQSIKYVNIDKEIKDVHCSSSEAAKTVGEKILIEPISCLEKCNRSQQEPEDNQARDLKEKVKEETNRVKRTGCHHLFGNENVHHLDNTEVVSPALSQVRRQLQDVLDQWANLNPSNILLLGPKSLLRRQKLWTTFKSVVKDSVISLAMCAALFSIYFFVFLSLPLILSVHLLLELLRNRFSEPDSALD